MLFWSFMFLHVTSWNVFARFVTPVQSWWIDIHQDLQIANFAIEFVPSSFEFLVVPPWFLGCQLHSNPFHHVMHQVTCCVCLLPLQAIIFLFLSCFCFHFFRTLQTKHWLLATIVVETTFASKELQSIRTAFSLWERMIIFIIVNCNSWLIVWIPDKGPVLVRLVATVNSTLKQLSKSHRLEKKRQGGWPNLELIFYLQLQARSLTVRTSAQSSEFAIGRISRTCPKFACKLSPNLGVLILVTKSEQIGVW